MKLKRVLQYAHSLLEESVSTGDIVVDATVGNGHDTLYLSNLVGESGQVYGYDIQEHAISVTRNRLNEEQTFKNVTLFQQSHSELHDTIPEHKHGLLSAAIFNLGYLPGSDKSVVTKPNSTIAACQQLLTLLKPGGLIIFVVYHGHEEGKIERDALIDYVSSIDQKKAHVLQYQFLNQQNNAPFIIAIEKRS